MRKLRIALAAMIMTLGLGVATLQPVGAINVFKNCSGGAVCSETKNAEAKTGTLVQNIVSTLLFVLGVICVIVIIVGGIRYALSGGDSSQISSAKNTILYAVVGLVVALLAYAIVNFVLAQIK